MTTQEHYSLRWNNHQNHILRAFDSLLQTKTLVDVTLVCAEKSIRAHKVVLSACSPFFQRVFSETPCKHPVIVLKDFRGWVVQAIVDFMYRGEISVPQERLQTLIQAGESLQVRGLVDHPVAGGNTPTPAASPEEFDMIDSISPESPLPSPNFIDDKTAILNSNTKLLLPPHVFVDTTGNLQNPEICTSPMPRRKQARPRRRSGECAPQDLSKPTTPVPQHITGSIRDGTSTSSLQTSVKHEQNTERHLHHHLLNNSKDDDDRPSTPNFDNDNDNDNENDNTSQASVEGPENLCMKNFEKTNNNNNHDNISNNNSNNNKNNSNNNNNNNTNNNNNNSNNNNSNNNRIVLSLKDIRHLNRVSSSIHHRPPLPPPPLPTNQLIPNLPLSPPPSHSNNNHNNSNNNHHTSHGHSVNNMKLETDDGHMERESPFMEQMELQLAHHNLLHGGHMLDHGGSLNSKDFSSTSPMSLPPHFSHQDGHHSQSPLPFPSMPGVSALTLTPPHMFGLDSPLGLFPPGMDPGKLYSPLLMEMSDPRGMHPETPPFLKKKSMNWSSLEWGITEGLPPHWSNVRGSRKMNRPKGQHSAPRGGPPRSWTNAELTEALQHVWNKKMTTSQASRIFGIPYNSLLMYVRGKYGKSLKLEQLRKDCISGPPIELLTMGMSGSNNNKGSSHNQNKDIKDIDTNIPRSSSSEPDLLSNSNQLFNPFPPGFYPDFGSGFPGIPLSVLNLLPPDNRQHPPLPMSIDEDCKSDRSKQSIEDDFPQPLALNRDERRELLQQNGQD